MDPQDLQDVQWSIWRALIGEVTPDLRAVYWSSSEGIIKARFIYSTAITPEHLENVAVIETEVGSDFPPTVETKFVAQHVDSDIQLTPDAEEKCLYRRKEKPIGTW